MTAVQGGSANQTGPGDLVKKPFQGFESWPVGLFPDPHQDASQRPQTHLARRRRQRRPIQQDAATIRLPLSGNAQDDRGRHHIQAFTRPPQMGGGGGDTRHRQTGIGQRRACLADLHPVEGCILIHRVFQPGLVPGLEIGAQLVAAHAQKRTRHSKPPKACHRPGRPWLHAGKAVQPAASGQPEQERLSLIVLVMADEKRADLVADQKVSHQPVACFARCRFDAGLGFFAAPGQHLRRKAQLLGPSRHLFGIGGRGFAKAVIHGQHNRQRKCIAARKAVQQMHQRNGIAAAGHSHRPRSGITGHRLGEGRFHGGVSGLLTCCRPSCGGWRRWQGFAAARWDISF